MSACPIRDVGPIVIPDGLEDDKVLFLSDILPTGWMAAENAQIEPGDTVAVWGCGPVGLFAIQSALLHGRAPRDRDRSFPAPARAGEAARRRDRSTIEETDVREALMEMTGGIGPDACIDASAWRATASASTISSTRSRRTPSSAPIAPHALRQAILACRKGGRVSIPGVYGGMADKFPLGALMEKGLTLKTGPDPRPEIYADAARADRARTRSIRPS